MDSTQNQATIVEVDPGKPNNQKSGNQPQQDAREPSQAKLDAAQDHFRDPYSGNRSLFDGSYQHKQGNGKAQLEPPHHEEVDEALLPNEHVQFILGREKDNSRDEDDSDEIPCLFVELEQLKTEDRSMIWKETGRWLKFEESVEEGGDRWSKPHVSSLGLHSVFELRSCILNGVVLLDVEARDFAQIAEMILEKIVADGHVPRNDDVILRVRLALMSGHEHQGENRKGLTRRKSIADFMVGRDMEGTYTSNGFSKPSSGRRESQTSLGDKKNKTPYFMKKIPPGSEAANVLVGEVDFIEQRIVAFVRLRESVSLGRLTEVPIPSRFVFFLLEPTGNGKQHHEIGRSIATLLNDEIFHEVAYKAKTKKGLLHGIDEFLDQVTVLPPGEWNSKIRIEPPKELPGDQKKRLLSMVPAIEEKEELQGHEIPPELKRTGRLFGGLINDIKRKAPFYLSDFKDCLSIQCVASFFFLYFAILSANVTFGGLLGDATQNYIGTVESLFGAAISGCSYHLLSGQPLTIIGSTGPILVFETILFELCSGFGLQYISFRVWVGIWTGVICILLVAFDVSSVITYVTRYTEESFSALISFIFIYEAFKKLINEGTKLKIWYNWDPNDVTLYQCGCAPPVLSSYNITHNVTIEDMKQASREAALGAHHSHYEGFLYKLSNISYVCASDGDAHAVSDIYNVSWNTLTKYDCITEYCGKLEGNSCSYYPDAVFVSVILFFGTFVISMGLKGLKTGRYFPTKVRAVISDFAVTIAIASMVLLDALLGINTSKLTVPSTFRPTRDDRTWFINPMGPNPWWSILLAIVPALLASVLVFMDQQITAVIVNRKENKLKKGCGYHLDLLIVAILFIVCSLMGLPWYVAATVRSISHVNSLKMESETSAPGETPKFLGVREQRVTGMVIFLMIGLSVLLTPILAYIPMPVLYGVFLFMGVSSLNGVQFFDRIKLFLMPPKHQPDFIYLRHVPLPKVYLFTAFQLIGFAVLWVIKSISPVSIVFPIMVVALIGIRKLYDYGIFTQEDLKWLDDLMPESTKKKKEDARKRKEAEAARQAEMMGDSGTVDIPLDGGKVIKVPISQVNYNNTRRQSVNISKEVSQTGIWKGISNSYSTNASEVRKRVADVERGGQRSDGSVIHEDDETRI